MRTFGNDNVLDSANHVLWNVICINSSAHPMLSNKMLLILYTYDLCLVIFVAPPPPPPHPRRLLQESCWISLFFLPDSQGNNKEAYLNREKGSKTVGIQAPVTRYVMRWGSLEICYYQLTIAVKQVRWAVAKRNFEACTRLLHLV